MITDEFAGTRGFYEVGRNNLYHRITDAWGDMRLSTRRLIAEQPSEARLLFYILLSDLIFFVSWSVKTLVAPASEAVIALPMEVAIWLVVAMFFRTSVIYFFSMVLGSAARVMGGQGSWRDTRTGVFWGALVASPFGFLFALVSAGIIAGEPHVPLFGMEAIKTMPYWISILPFLWFISAGLAEAHNFKRTSYTFAGVMLFCLLLLVVFLAFAGSRLPG